MPRKKTIQEDLVVEQQAAGEVVETNQPEALMDATTAQACLQRAHDMIDVMNQQHWALNSTALKSNLLMLVEYGLEFIKQERAHADE
jgi:hypothetical protein